MSASAPMVAVVGLGYVGLPLVVEFGKHAPTLGFDVAPDKVAKCRAGSDPSREIPDEEMALARHARYSDSAQDLGEAHMIIVAVPTPVDDAKIPDFSPLVAASRTIGAHMKPGTTVIYESTVYPGATEEICTPNSSAHPG